MTLFEIIFGSLTTLVVVGCYIIAISFTIWMMIDAGKQDRFWWLTLVIGVPVIGPAVYYFTEKKHDYKKVETHHIHESETEEQHERAPKKKSSRKIKKENVSEAAPVQKEESHQEEVIIPEQNKEEKSVTSE